MERLCGREGGADLSQICDGRSGRDWNVLEKLLVGSLVSTKNLEGIEVKLK